MSTGIIALLLASSLLTACSGDERLPEHELTGDIFGTTYSIKLVAPGPDLDKEALAGAVAARLEEIDAIMSTYNEDSELSRFNHSDSEGWITTSAELCGIVDAALEVSRETGGAFDVTVGPLVNLWGFGPGEIIAEPPTDGAIAEALSRVGFAELEADCGRPALRKRRTNVYVDLSAVAKGHAVDVLTSLLDGREVENYLVEIGGELSLRGHNAAGKPWAIAIEKPTVSSRGVQTVVHLTDTAMATSGDYRNYFEFEGQRFSHTISPHTGRPVEHDAAAVTVVAGSAARADAMATALLVMGPDDGMRYAAENGMAAYFLLRTGGGVEERSTGEFAHLLN